MKISQEIKEISQKIQSELPLDSDFWNSEELEMLDYYKEGMPEYDELLMILDNFKETIKNLERIYDLISEAYGF